MDNAPKAQGAPVAKPAGVFAGLPAPLFQGGMRTPCFLNGAGNAGLLKNHKDPWRVLNGQMGP